MPHSLLSDPHFWLFVAVYWVFSAAVGSMPEPKEASSEGYTFLFKFLHTLAGNLTTAFGSKIPGNK